MKKRTFTFNCADGTGKALSEVLFSYADAAYPKGGSPCSQATREALETMAHQIRSADEISISTRQRPMLKSAINWYFEEVRVTDTSMRQKLLDAIAKK